MPRRLQIALLIESSRAYGRGLLRGIAEYARTFQNWSIFLNERGLGDDLPDWLRRQFFDGFIVRAENPELVEYLQKSQTPTVDLRALIKIPGVPTINTDDKAVVDTAISLLTDRGFKHLAFYGFGGANYSEQRCRYFRQCIHDLKVKPHVLELPIPQSTLDTSAIEAMGLTHELAIAAWIAKLPKPVGLLACNDIAAQQVLNVCSLSGIAVPEDVAVVGVDDDEVLCELSDPTLTSVAPDTHKIGYEAARLLDRIIAGEAVEIKDITIPPIGVVERNSTDSLAISDRLVATAMRFIREHVGDGINVDNVLDHLEISRSQLERRFAAALQQTPSEAIVRIRLTRVKQLLIETELPLAQIAKITGFRHAEYMSVQFKKKIGITPGQFRSNRTSS